MFDFICLLIFTVLSRGVRFFKTVEDFNTFGLCMNLQKLKLTLFNRQLLINIEMVLIITLKKASLLSMNCLNFVKQSQQSRKMALSLDFIYLISINRN